MDRATTFSAKVSRSMRYMFKDLSRRDKGFLNNLLRYTLYFITPLSDILVIWFAVLGFREVGAFGPISLATELGYTNEGLIVELFFILIINFITYNVLRQIMIVKYYE